MHLENERYIATFTAQDGEIESFKNKETGMEYMWQGDETYWKGKNPTLFPLIRSTFDHGNYTIDGKTYHMKNHSLVRYEDLEVKTQKDKIIMVLDSNPKLLAKYPFEFHYEIEYVLHYNCLNITYRITNTGKRDMPFMLGRIRALIARCVRMRCMRIIRSAYQNTSIWNSWFLTTRKKAVQRVELQEIPCDYSLSVSSHCEGMMSLKPEETFTAGYTIEVFLISIRFSLLDVLWV